MAVNGMVGYNGGRILRKDLRKDLGKEMRKSRGFDVSAKRRLAVYHVQRSLGVERHLSSSKLLRVKGIMSNLSIHTIRIKNTL
jgi:hypothetical protein